MLQRAAAALAEMAADGRDAVGAGLEDFLDRGGAAVAAGRAGLHAQAVARRGEGNIEPSVGRAGDAVALRADCPDRYLHRRSLRMVQPRSFLIAA